ncbi:MAG: ABC transporter ATP-binding protein [Tannerellaceae bacterium]|jgi:iron complex transport system ATP-binding protein|nr:ABC transporter ATP-binding protein [Tannerellaceae bacterium]
MVNIKHLDFSYGKYDVLHDVNVQVRGGDFWAVIGPNGSGKSTLIKCIAAILHVKSGTILIDGKSSVNYTANQLAQTVAYIPQTEKGDLQSLVFDTVLAGRKPYIRWKPSEDDYGKVADVLHQLGIEHLSMRYVNALSGGQQQTVMIARALAQQTKILLLDEPTANLDLRHQLEIMNLLKMLSFNGLTIVMSLHDINLAIRYASHVLMLKDGGVLVSDLADHVTQTHIENLYNIKVEMITNGDVRYYVPLGVET